MSEPGFTDGGSTVSEETLEGVAPETQKNLGSVAIVELKPDDSSEPIGEESESTQTETFDMKAEKRKALSEAELAYLDDIAVKTKVSGDGTYGAHYGETIKRNAEELFAKMREHSLSFGEAGIDVADVDRLFVASDKERQKSYITKFKEMTGASTIIWTDRGTIRLENPEMVNETLRTLANDEVRLVAQVLVTQHNGEQMMVVKETVSSDDDAFSKKQDIRKALNALNS
jgi:hypothetical protein